MPCDASARGASPAWLSPNLPPLASACLNLSTVKYWSKSSVTTKIVSYLGRFLTLVCYGKRNLM